MGTCRRSRVACLGSLCPGKADFLGGRWILQPQGCSRERHSSAAQACAWICVFPACLLCLVHSLMDVLCSSELLPSRSSDGRSAFCHLWLLRSLPEPEVSRGSSPPRRAKLGRGAAQDHTCQAVTKAGLPGVRPAARGGVRLPEG